MTINISYLFNNGFLNEQSQKPIRQTIPIEFKSTMLDTPEILGARTPLVQFLKNRLPDIDFIVSEAGPIDFYGMGDSVLAISLIVHRKYKEKAVKGYTCC